MLLVGILIAFPMWYLSGYLWGRFAASRFDFKLEVSLFGGQDNDTIENPPSVGTVIALLLLRWR